MALLKLHYLEIQVTLTLIYNDCALLPRFYCNGYSLGPIAGNHINTKLNASSSEVLEILLD